MEQTTRERILAPFDENSNPNWEGGLVISPDWDGLLSAAIVCNHYEDAFVAGFYDPHLTPSRSVLYLSEELLPSSQGDLFCELGKTVWIDLDITDSRIISIGQHMIRHRTGPDGDITRGEHGFSRNPLSFNPNDIRDFGWDPIISKQCAHMVGQPRRGVRRRRCSKRAFFHDIHCPSHGGQSKPEKETRGFSRKYPFSTAHILIAALGFPADIEITDNHRLAFFHADSSGIVASQRAANSMDWHHSFSPECEFTNMISGPAPPFISSLEVLEAHIRFIMELQELRIIDMTLDEKFSQYESEVVHMNILAQGLTGVFKQYIPLDSLLDDDCLRRIETAILDLLGLRIRFSGRFVEAMDGTPHNMKENNPIATNEWDFSNWLAENQVFSIVFSRFNSFRYTSNMQQIELETNQTQ